MLVTLQLALCAEQPAASELLTAGHADDSNARTAESCCVSVLCHACEGGETVMG